MGRNSRVVDYELTEDLVREIKQMREQGKLLGEIAYVVDWPYQWSLEKLGQIAGELPKGMRATEISTTGPVCQARVGSIYGGTGF